MDYLLRTVDLELDELLSMAPAIAIDGPKGVGKTYTAARRTSQQWFLDNPEHRALLAADPELTSSPDGTILIDEWQRLPRIWDAVRRHVDRGAPPGRFLLTGSATPVAGVDTHSGAGRVLSLRMHPMALHERGLTAPTVSLRRHLEGDSDVVEGSSSFVLSDYVEAITGSGFPGLLGAPARLRNAQLDAYLRRVVERDLPEQGYVVRRPETLRAGSQPTRRLQQQPLPIHASSI